PTRSTSFPYTPLFRSVDDGPRARVDARLHVPGDLVAVLARDKRAHVRGVVVGPVPHADRGHALGDLLDELVRDGFDGHEGADRHAALTGGSEARAHGGVGGLV